MLEQELRDLMGRDYPRDDDDREVLLLRVTMFPNSIDIYDNHLHWIYDRTVDWFLVEQCIPELADEMVSEKRTYEYFEDFMESGDLSKIDWPNFYAYVDRVCDEYPYYRNTKFFQAVEKYREQLLNSGYDII